MRIEFLVPDDSDTIYIKDGEKIERLSDRKDIVDQVYYFIKDNYPEAFDALFTLYGIAADHKFLMARRFVKCNFSKYDSVIDFDGSEFNFEKIFCPMRGECKYDKIICAPRYNTNISPAELKVMELIAQNLEDSVIADRLYKSIHTINAQRKSIERKLGLKNKQDIASYYQKHYPL